MIDLRDHRGSERSQERGVERVEAEERLQEQIPEEGPLLVGNIGVVENHRCLYEEKDEYQDLRSVRKYFGNEEKCRCSRMLAIIEEGKKNDSLPRPDGNLIAMLATDVLPLQSAPISTSTACDRAKENGGKSSY